MKTLKEYKEIARKLGIEEKEIKKCKKLIDIITLIRRKNK